MSLVYIVWLGVLNDERMKHGNGVYQWKKAADEDGGDPVVRATYDGEYSNGKKHGLGKLTYPNGDVYQGQFKENKLHGEGTYVYKKTGDIYSGTWVEGVKSGQGSYQFGADHSVLKGSWVNGTITTGQWLFTDGTIYTGSFLRGKPVGPGSFALSNGITQAGEYVVAKPAEGEEVDPEAEPKINWIGTPVVAV